MLHLHGMDESIAVLTIWKYAALFAFAIAEMFALYTNYHSDSSIHTCQSFLEWKVEHLCNLLAACVLMCGPSKRFLYLQQDINCQKSGSLSW